MMRFESFPGFALVQGHGACIHNHLCFYEMPEPAENGSGGLEFGALVIDYGQEFSP